MAKAEIPKERLERYLEITKAALEKVKVTPPKRSHLLKTAEEFLEMARAYYNDALFFYSQDNYVNAFACVNYAHGWLDAGAKLGLFDVGQDDKLFTLDA